MNSVNPNQLVPDRTNAIPCQYKGINFRSLLEARWAYFFDKLGFEWEYEPFEMDGYIPDFVVKSLEKDCLFIIDVKPFFSKEYKKAVRDKIVDGRMSPCGDELYVLFVSYPTTKWITYSTHECDFDENVQYPVFVLADAEPLFSPSKKYESEWHFAVSPYRNIVAPHYKDCIVAFEYCAQMDDYPCRWIYPASSWGETIPYDINMIKVCFGAGSEYSFEYAIFVGGIVDYYLLSGYMEEVERYESYWKEACNATQYKPQKPKQFIT